MFSAYSAVNTLYRSDKWAANAALLLKAENVLKKARIDEDDIHTLLKDHTASVSWQAHIAGFEETINGGVNDSDDSDSDDDDLETIRKRRAALDKYQEELTPNKPGA